MPDRKPARARSAQAPRTSARCLRPETPETPIFAHGLNELDYCEPCWRQVTGIPALSIDDRSVGYPHPAPRGKVPLPKRTAFAPVARPDYRP